MITTELHRRDIDGSAIICRTAFGERTDVDFLVAREPKLVRLASSPEAIKVTSPSPRSHGASSLPPKVREAGRRVLSRPLRCSLRLW